MLSESHAKRRQELNVSVITNTLSRTPQSICHERESQQSGSLKARTLQLTRRKILSSQMRSFSPCTPTGFDTHLQKAKLSLW